MDSKMSFDIGKRRTDLGRMSMDNRKLMGDKEKRDGNLGMGTKQEGGGGVKRRSKRSSGLRINLSTSISIVSI